MRSASSSGVAFSMSSVEAPTRKREHHEAAEAERESERRRAGEHVVRRSAGARAWRTCRRSRARRGGSAWSPSADPVVPEVKASSATSSAAVSTGVELVRRLHRPCARGRRPRRRRTRRSGPCRGSAAAQVVEEPVVAERDVDLRDLGTVLSSLGRSSGIVVTTTAPACSTPNQQATSHGLFGPRSRTRLPGTTPSSSTSTWATWLDVARSSPYVQRSPSAASRQGRSAPCRSIVRVEELDARSSAGRGTALGEVEDELRPGLDRRQVVAAEGVDVRRRTELSRGTPLDDRPVFTARDDSQGCATCRGEGRRGLSCRRDDRRAGARRRACQPRALIVTVYGLYAREIGGGSASSTLIRLLAEVGVDEPAVRSSISRLKRRGVLEAADRRRHRRLRAVRRRPERSSTRATGGSSSAREATVGDGWLLAVFSVPESERAPAAHAALPAGLAGLRHRAAGVWIAPAHLEAETRDVLERDGLAAYVDLFRADVHGVRRHWPGWCRAVVGPRPLGARYDDFLTAYAPGADPLERRRRPDRP